MDSTFEDILSNFAPFVVGILAQHVYGYKPIPEGASDSEEIETDRENAKSLAKALYTAVGIPMTICCFIYSFLYCTYPGDRDRARMDALIESEMPHLETDYDSQSTHVSESQMINKRKKEEPTSSLKERRALILMTMMRIHFFPIISSIAGLSE